MKKRKKKLVDLIFLEDEKTESQLKIEYQSRIETWLEWLENKQNDEEQLQDAYIEEQTEFYMVSNVLKHFISKRLDWILKSVSSPELRKKYLSVLQPFSQNGNLKRFLLHFFQLVEADSKQERLKFQFLNNSEREINILWDIYKLTKTIESIATLIKAVKSIFPFPSSFSPNYTEELLSTLKDIAQLLIKICIKPAYHKSILKKFPISVFDADTILKRKEAEDYLVADIVLEKYDYRNYIFYIYFRPNIKAIYQNKEISFKFNYLDYEIIRQEFLMDWLSVRLKNNPKKQIIFDKYMQGNQSFNQIIESNPKMELTLLKQLPVEVFNDLIGAVNQSVDKKDKVTIDPLSEKFGTFSQHFKQFNSALKFANKSLKKLKQYVLNSKADSNKSFEFPPDIEKQPQPEKKSTGFSKMLLKKDEIVFPYFCKQGSLFSKQHTFLKTKLGSRYKGFQSQVVTHLIRTSDNHLITRRTPRHEWVTAHLLEESGEHTSTLYLLILGADLKAKPLGMGYANEADGKYYFKPYFVFGSTNKIIGLGEPTEERVARDKVFQIYDFFNPLVIEKVLKLVDLICD
jgi:hypothetical protein